MRTNKVRLYNLFAALANKLDWDCTSEAYTPREDGKGSKATIGHTFLCHQTYAGWSIRQMANEGGAERVIKESCDANEMGAWLSGALYAARAIKGT